MNSERNLPVYLHYEEDGTVSARCPLMPEIQCRSATRALALGTMQQLLRRAPKVTPQHAQKYEIVFLAVAASSDNSSRHTRGAHGRARRYAHP
ncbi:hypothetical protein LZC95_37755 [Pendulispora brunnea]|uniref:Velvet domain-containing protein n=1 Tax=Pendulispora brunnea TaxID=2905690 RepID=A0ABZ2K0C1_9BACT